LVGVSNYSLGTNNKIRTVDETVSDVSDNFFELISSGDIAFNIISPNGGEVIEQSSTVSIFFNAFGLNENDIIVLEYSTDGFNWTDLSKSTVGLLKGKFDWFVDPSVFVAAERYRFRIRNQDESAFDESDNIFQIIEEIIPTVTLSTPIGGESIEQNSTLFITWEGTNFDGSESINIDYSADAGVNRINLETATAASLEEFIWFVDESVYPFGTDYQIRVQIREGTVSDESGTFEISAPLTLGIAIVTPNGGEQLEHNSTATIKYNSQGLSGNEQIDFEWSVDGIIWNAIASSTVAQLAG
jgi:hypothetical protein